MRRPGTAVVAALGVLGAVLGAIGGAACSTGDGSSASSTVPREPASVSSPTGRSGEPAAVTTTTTTAPAVPVIADAGWHLPSARDREVALTDGTVLWLLGGRDPGKSSRTSVLQIEPSTGAATAIGDLAVAVHDAAGARLGGTMFVFGGGNSNTIATVQSFTPGVGAAVEGKLPQARSDLVATTVGHHAYVVGGFDGAGFTPDVLDTTDGAHFSVIATLPVPVRYPAIAAAGRRLYVFGGVLAGGFESATGDSNAIQEVDLDRRTARIVAELPHTLSHSTAVTVRGETFVLGGRLDGAVSSRAWRFELDRGGLLPVGTLPVAVSDSAAVVVHDTAYLLGGESAADVPVASVATVRLR